LNGQKAKLKQRIAVSPDNNLMVESGRNEEMSGKLQI
jgi:hypothetical protein